MRIQYRKRGKGGYWAYTPTGETKNLTVLVESKSLGTSKVGAVDYWTARCPRYGISADGNTRKEAAKAVFELALKERA